MATKAATLIPDRIRRTGVAPREETTVSAPMSAKRIPELDGLRGLAVSLVLIFHFADGAISPTGHRWLFYLGDVFSLSWSGVDLFFVLSGFLLGGILLDARNSPNFFKAFYTRRVFRIIPVYALIVGLFYLCKGAGVPGRLAGSDWLFGPTAHWYAYATFTQNFQYAIGGPNLSNWLRATWSLAVEEQFYLILPMVIWFVPIRRLPYFLGGAILVAPLLRLFLDTHYSWGAEASFNLMPCRADALLLGVAAALVVRHAFLWKSLKTQRWRLASVWMVLLGGFAFIGRFKSFEPNSFWMSTIGYSWLAAIYVGLLLLALEFSDSWLGRMFRNSWLKALGTISYGLYLFHMPVLGLTFAVFRGMRPWAETPAERLLVPLALIFSIAIASVSWTYFEKPLLKIGHAVKY
jgi:peptidoglycan/LPS O-acetylase OafA/YrhL